VRKTRDPLARFITAIIIAWALITLIQCFDGEDYNEPTELPY
jgi:hypothetical protein